MPDPEPQCGSGCLNCKRLLPLHHCPEPNWPPGLALLQSFFPLPVPAHTLCKTSAQQRRIALMSLFFKRIRVPDWHAPSPAALLQNHLATSPTPCLASLFQHSGHKFAPSFTHARSRSAARLCQGNNCNISATPPLACGGMAWNARYTIETTSTEVSLNGNNDSCCSWPSAFHVSLTSAVTFYHGTGASNSHAMPGRWAQERGQQLEFRSCKSTLHCQTRAPQHANATQAAPAAILSPAS